MATVMPTWLTGALVRVWIARSGPEPPRNSQTSPVRVSFSACVSDTVCSVTSAA